MNYKVEYMVCDLCHKKLHPLDAHCGRIREKFITTHIDCWNKAIEIVKVEVEDIFDSIEACESQPNCNQCVISYESDFDNNDLYHAILLEKNMENLYRIIITQKGCSISV